MSVCSITGWNAREQLEAAKAMIVTTVVLTPMALAISADRPLWPFDLAEQRAGAAPVQNPPSRLRPATTARSCWAVSTAPENVKAGRPVVFPGKALDVGPLIYVNFDNYGKA